MSQRIFVLSLVAAFGLPVIVLAGRAPAALPPIQAVKGVKPKPSVFKAAGRNKPLVIRSEAEAAEHFGDAAAGALIKQVDFKQQIVLVFAWRGSGQDRLAYSVAESFPEQISFTFRPGRTRDLRPHMRIYALRSNVSWRGPKGGAAGGANATVKPAKKRLAAAKKHPRYKEINEAKNVVIATLDEANATAVSMSYPPTYGFGLTLTIGEVLRGSLKPKQRLQCTYSKSGVKKPSLPVGKRCLVLLRAGRRNSQAYSLEQASEDLLKIARIAASEANKTDKANATIARDKPDKHPLYAMLKKAEGVVVATGNPEGTASHDSRGVSTQSEICVISMKGTLKPGDQFQAVFPPAVAPQGKLPDAEFLIVGYERIAGKHQVICVAEASDTNLRVAAAATGTPLRTLKDVQAVKLPAVKRTKPAPRSSQSSEPQSGQTTPGG